MVVAKKRIPRKIKEFSFFNIGLFNYFTAVNSNFSIVFRTTLYIVYLHMSGNSAELSSPRAGFSVTGLQNRDPSP